MEGRRRWAEETRKGPWKAEEDEVLINHVKRYGPRDWSSIRSKGLLQRTGKSCRLRWVNKLRPNLKNGCKFTAEEERMVIQLQAELGNKWARIATYLPGRTDNDVKNFWSSRQKRLARILHSSTTSTSSSSSSSFNAKSLKSSSSNKGQVAPAFRRLPTLEAPLFSSSMEEESSFEPQSCLSFFVETPEPITMASPPPQPPNVLKIELPCCDDTSDLHESQSLIPFVQMPQPQPELTFSPDSHALLTGLEDPYLHSMFGPVAAELGDASQLALPAPLLDPTTNCMNISRDVRSSATLDTFFDDFPENMFDPIEPLPNPSEW